MLVFALAVIAIIIVWQLMLKPSNDRNWSADQDTLPYAEINGNLVTMHNIRNFTYRSTSDYTESYYDKTYDLNKIKNVYYIVEPFAGLGAAHTFLSYEFEDDTFLSISVEIRKEKGEKFSPLKGLFKQFEIMYVVADEKDVVKLRTNYRKDQVFLYPIKASKEGISKLFMSMVNDINALNKEPAFYNTAMNNCMTTIAHHVNKVTTKKVPWNYTHLLPLNSDKYALELGLIDSLETDITALRAKYKINALAEQFADSEDFSLKIRGR